MSRNVVLLTVDSLRADHCGFMGYEESVTPALDERAAAGVVYENAVAPSYATPHSMPGIFTGLESRGGSETFDSSRERIRNHLRTYRTIQDGFSSAGYTSIGFTPNPFTSRHFGFDSGFDRFEDFLDADGPLDLRGRIVSRWANDEFVAGLRFGMNMLGFGDVSMSWEDYYDDVLADVEAADEPFFLWIFLLEPHWPYRPPRRHRDTSLLEMYRRNWRRAPLSDADLNEDDADVLRSLYDGTLRHVDEFVERISEDLSEYDPAFALHADHGEAFGEHGNFGHGSHLYEENVHVPLVLWNVGTSGRVTAPVSLRRLPALLRDVAGLADSADPAGAYLERHTSSFAAASAGDARAVRGESVKIVRDDDGERIYLLEDDPGELEPIEPDEDTAVGAQLLAHGDADRRERELIATAGDDLAAGGGTRDV